MQRLGLESIQLEMDESYNTQDRGTLDDAGGDRLRFQRRLLVHR